jgi:hypothetical protein
MTIDIIGSLAQLLYDLAYAVGYGFGWLRANPLLAFALVAWLVGRGLLATAKDMRENPPKQP